VDVNKKPGPRITSGKTKLYPGMKCCGDAKSLKRRISREKHKGYLP
jgi:hypothetical protein